MSAFRSWLADTVRLAPEEWPKEVTTFATVALLDKRLPRSSTLHVILKHYENRPEIRSLAKKAHREWRRSR
jgi:hypothetical protein